MVTYCIGSARQKRAYFKDMEYVVLDNVEVLFSVRENGRNYFAFGDVPFADFTVGEYLNYSRALESKVSDDVIAAFGLDKNKKLGRLCAVKMRTVLLLEQTAGEPDKPVVINLDGTKCSRRNVRALRFLLQRITSAYVCVTDERFLKKARGEYRTLRFGKSVNAKRPAFYAAKVLAKRIGAKRVAEM